MTFSELSAGPTQVFATRVAGNSRTSPPELEEVGAARAPGLHGRKQSACGRRWWREKQRKSEAFGVTARSDGKN